MSRLGGKLLVAAALMISLLIGCERAVTAPESHKVAVREPQKLTSEALDADFKNSTMSLEPSSSRTLSGDMRPLWIASGRIANQSEFNIKSVEIHLIAKKIGSDEILDTADFQVGDVPAMEAKGFRREVQLMVYPGKFQFEWTFQSATIKSAE